MDDPRLPELVHELCLLAGKKNGLEPKKVYVMPTLQDVAAPAIRPEPEDQGEALSNWLWAQLQDWRWVVTLRNKQIHPDTYMLCLLRLLYNWSESADERRLAVMREVGVRGVSVQQWRKNIEPQFLEPFARHLIRHAAP